MSIDVTDTGTPLTERVAEEIRAWMGRRRLSQAELARQLGVSKMWVSYRLNGVQPIDVNDLHRIARILQVAVTDLLPSDVRRGQETNHGKSPVPDRPKDNRPKGRADQRVSTGPETRRPRRIGALTAMGPTRSAA